MKTRKERKTVLKFALKMMDKAIEMQHAKNKFQELKNEEIRLQSTQIKGEILELKSPFNEDEPIDEKFKEEVENDPMFRLMEEIFSPEKNKERLEQIEKSLNLPKGAIVVKVVKREKDDVCDCPACQLRRQLEKGENGLN